MQTRWASTGSSGTANGQYCKGSGGGRGDRPGGLRYTPRPGDWKCLICGLERIFGSRTECGRCGAQKPKGDGAAAKATPVAKVADEPHWPQNDTLDKGLAQRLNAEATPVADDGGASGATPSNTWATRASKVLPGDDDMRLRSENEKRKKMVELVRSVYGDKTPEDIATVLRLYELLHGSKPVMTGPVEVKYTERKSRAGKLVWYTDVSPTGTFDKGPYAQKPTLKEHEHIGGAATIRIFYTKEGDEEAMIIMVFMHKKKENESPEEEKRAVSKVRNAILDGVTNRGIQHRCCTYTVYDRDGNEKHLPQAFADLANKAGFDDPEKVRFTTLVLTNELFEEYIAVVDGNNATRNEQMTIHNEDVERLTRFGASQCPKFPSQDLLEDLGPLPNGTITTHIFGHIVKELPRLPGFRTGYDVVRYENGRIIVVRLPNLNGSTPPLNQKWSAIVQDWYAENKDSIAQKILTDIRAHNREWREQNKAEREERSHLFGHVSFGAGDGKGSHRGKVARGKTLTQMKTGAPAPVTAKPTHKTINSVTDADIQKMRVILREVRNGQPITADDEKFRATTIRNMTPKQRSNLLG